MAGAIGNFIEWFDYSIYGFMAVTIAGVFFPSDDPTAGLLATFGVFALPVITRPLGGVVFARFGDRIGRKRTLALVLILMSLSTGAIGLIPSYAAIGVAAPVLLVIARIVQGFSAGGEYAGGAALIAESVPARRRGMMVSLMPASTGFGLLAGSLFAFALTSSLTDAQMESWGWRVGFLIAIPMGMVGLYIRLRLEETAAFQEIAESDDVAGSPVRETLQAQWANVLKVAGIALGQTVCYYVVLVYTPTFLRTELDYSESDALLTTSLAIAAYVLTIPVAGRLSDRLGRKPPLFVGSVAMLVFVFPTFLLFDGGNLAVIGVLQALVGGLALGCYTGPLVCVWVELFPTRVRYTGVSLGFNLSVIASVSSPFVLTWLISRTGSDLMPAWYVAAAVAVSFLTLFVLPETAPAKGGHDHITPASQQQPDSASRTERDAPRSGLLRP
ncbi:MFS transporter, MHS family, proline/betaine transporter [Streptomyces zhaozhouensis]|uniref:Putative proline/betaine transporter n=1 Tax=Streptomyces zhaozhouensis TaxID=1300267 RepID=A0A286DN30_9ACTN|nr:MFS transporter [Streptomyces zhaozhouensis]SOD60118.1 MFS transporter, MHS family, proline/betaine transporter [Streptomyces zhaozhouensis]